jgi:hypothetical protein
VICKQCGYHHRLLRLSMEVVRLLVIVILACWFAAWSIEGVADFAMMFHESEFGGDYGALLPEGR